MSIELQTAIFLATCCIALAGNALHRSLREFDWHALADVLRYRHDFIRWFFK